MSERRWGSTHRFYHADQDAVLTRVVKPAVERLRRDGLADGFMFLRYREGAAHVRLRVLTRSGSVQEVRSVVEETAAEFYQSPESGSATFDTVPEPDDSAAFIGYAPETDLFGTDRALDAVERQLMASSALAVELIARGRTPGRRALDAFAMLAANRTLFTGILPELAYHARFIVESGGAAAELLGSAGFERHFDANKAQLRASLEAVWAVTRGAALPAASVAGMWLAAVRDLSETLIELESLGGLDDYPGLPGLTVPLDVLEHINHVVPQLIVERCAHLMCNQLGIDPVQEAHLRLLLTRTSFDLCAG